MGVEEVKSPKGVKRKTDQKVPGGSASAAKTDLDLKAKKVKKQDTAGDDRTSSSQHQKASAGKKAINKPNIISKKKSDKKSLTSKTTSKSDGKSKVKKTALLKVSKKIFSSKPKKRALNSVRQSEEDESCNNSSSQNN